MTKVGVTGAAGFIGSHLCDRLLFDGCEVVGVDDLSTGSLANLAYAMEHDRFAFRRLDCSRLDALRAAFTGCDAIIHLAAKKIPRYGGALNTLESNVSGAKACAEVALEMDADLLIASTSDVYGNAPLPFREDGPLMLGQSTSRRWAYAVSKLFDEHLVLAMAEEFGLRTTVMRFFGSYGPRNHPSWWGGPQAAFIERLLSGEEIDIHGDGEQVRTFTYIADTVEGIVRCLRTPEARGEVVNIGGNRPVTINELAILVHETLGISPLRAKYVPYSELPGKYEDVIVRIPDMSKARDLLGFEATVSLEEGLAETAAWHRALRAGAGRAERSAVPSAEPVAVKAA